MPAIAFSNNDIALLAWTFDRHLEGCLGFAVYQRDMSTGAERPLPALARFASQDPNAQLTTADAPVQKFWWKDLYARRGGTYQYRIVPLGGRPGALAPLAGAEPLLSNSVTLTHERPPFKAYFNRGIVASQAVIHALGDKADINILKSHITDPADDLRARLMGQIFEGITSLLDRADDSGGQVHAALYELDDPAGLEQRLQAKDRGNPKSRTVILGNERVTDPQTKEVIEDADAENRQHLKDAGVDVLDRILRKDSIPHNKFMVLSEGDQPTAVLTGSTNWTSSGLATQTNNVLVIESPRAAQAYLAYWNELKRDLDQAGGEQGKLQGKELRAWTNKTNGATVATPITLEDGSATVEPLFSPNTKATLKRPPKEKPNDMQRLFELVSGAKQAILFLAFDPGNNSILDAAGAALAKNPDLFVRGALTSTQRAANFRAALEKSADVEPGNTADMHVAVVGEKGKPRPKGKKGKGAKGGGERIEPDYRAIPAGSVTKNDAFGAWEAELYKYGHAIIHNKIVVIDPFSANCAVITGSHNLGYRASHNNDENLVIVRGHRPLAQAYACHVLDLYDHYAWRYWLQRFPKQFGKPLEEDDGWQERYIKDSEEKSPELRFWLSAVSGGIMPAVERGPQRPRSRRGMTSKSKSRSSKARTSRGARKPSTPRKKAGARKTKGHKAKAHKAKAHKTKARKAPKPAARRRKAARTGR